MRVAQAALLTAILVVLCVIAVQLHRIAEDFQLGADVRHAIADYKAPAPAPAETHQQEVDRRAREVVAARKSAAELMRTHKEVDERVRELEAAKGAASR